VDDEAEGIFLSREIGTTAFNLHRYGTATGEGAKALLAQVATESKLAPLSFAARAYRQSALARLEGQLGMAVEELALPFTFCP
jgi:hypothetical protein